MTVQKGQHLVRSLRHACPVLSCPVLSCPVTDSHAMSTTYNWINQLSNTTIWWLDICCLLHRYQLHVSALMAIFRLID